MSDTLLVVLASTGLHLDLHHRLLLAVDEVLVARIEFETLIVGLQRLVVFLHHLVTGAFSRVGFDEFRVKFEALLGVLECGNEFHELDPGHAAVGVDGNALGITLEALVVFFESFRVFAFLEKG